MFQVTLHIRGALALGFVLGMNEASPTNAQTADITKGAQVLNGILAPTVGQKACFSRTYDGAHLRQHPRQQVMAMSFELRYVRTPSADIERYEFSMSVRTRARPNTLYTSGVCETNVDSTYPGGNLCTVDCDGGGVSIEKVTGADALYVHLDTPSGGISMGRSCDAAGKGNPGARLEPGADDKLFRLDKVAVTTCRALEKTQRELWPG